MIHKISEFFFLLNFFPYVRCLGSAIVKLAVLYAGLHDFSDLVEGHMAAVHGYDLPVPVRPAENSRAASLVLAEFLSFENECCNFEIMEASYRKDFSI